MSIKRKKSSGGGGANWMDTYGDMVTLLLCFFVLLYSMSTISEDKWKAIVQSFNPDSILEQTEIPPGNDGPSADSQPLDVTDPNLAQSQEELEEMQQEIDGALERLYQALKEYTAQQNMEGSIEITKGDGYVFVSFNEAVFFDGNSYTLRPEGQEVLTAVAEILSQASEYIDEVRVMGHTAQALADVPNEVYSDRFLSSNRATIATVYIQEHSNLSPARLVSEGYGQHRPVASNETEETRKKNRRIEILISGFDVLSQLGDSIEQYQVMRGGST